MSTTLMPAAYSGDSSLLSLFEELRDAGAKGDTRRVCEILRGFLPNKVERLALVESSVREEILKISSVAFEQEKEMVQEFSNRMKWCGKDAGQCDVCLQEMNTEALLPKKPVIYCAHLISRTGKTVPFPVGLIFWDGSAWTALRQGWYRPDEPKWTSNPVRYLMYHYFWPYMPFAPAGSGCATFYYGGNKTFTPID